MSDVGSEENPHATRYDPQSKFTQPISTEFHEGLRLATSIPDMTSCCVEPLWRQQPAG